MTIGTLRRSLRAITTFLLVATPALAFDTADLARARGGDRNLTGANLTGANLTGANLTGANLTGARISDANLTGANLRGANLTGAYLGDANLSNANLSGADLSGANLSVTDLHGADFTGANLTGADLMGVRCDASTHWPAGFTPPSCREVSAQPQQSASAAPAPALAPAPAPVPVPVPASVPFAELRDHAEFRYRAEGEENGDSIDSVVIMSIAAVGNSTDAMRRFRLSWRGISTTMFPTFNITIDASGMRIDGVPPLPASFASLRRTPNRRSGWYLNADGFACRSGGGRESGHLCFDSSGLLRDYNSGGTGMFLGLRGPIR